MHALLRMREENQYGAMNYRQEILQAMAEIATLTDKPIGIHLALATQEYSKIDFISDKEMAHVLKNYLRQEELADLITDDEEYD